MPMAQGDERPTPWGRNVSPECIFFALIVGVQTFMAFNGGATSATIDSIEKGDSTWGPAGIGFLGAMDKLGMTISSPLCGFLFQLFPAKTLLSCGLFINASACLLFGSLRSHQAMFAAKLLIGITEGLQWVWAPRWISTWASLGQEDASGEKSEVRKQVWMNLNSSVVAGVGAGLGIVVAGLGTANGLSYSFAFLIESGVLFLLWFVMLSVNGDLLAIEPNQGLDEGILSALEPAGSSDRLLEEKEASKKSVAEQASELWQNTLFCRCAVAFAMVNFTVAGMQFLWVRLYTGLWGVTKTVAVLSQLIIVAAGGATGVALSSTAKFTDSPGGKQRLAFTTKGFAIATLGALAAGCGAVLQLHGHANSNFTLYLVYGGVFVTVLGLNMTPGILQIICMETVDINQTRTFGTGVYQGLNNFLGLAMGPFVPQLMMSIVEKHYDLESADGKDPEVTLCAGFVCALCGAGVALICSAAAWYAATDEESGFESLSDEEEDEEEEEEVE